MAAALTAIAFLAFVGLRRTLMAQLDDALRVTAELQARSFREGRSLGHLGGSTGEAERFIREVNRLVVVRDSLRRIIDANTDAARRLPLDTAAFSQAVSGTPALAVARGSDGWLRTIYLRIPSAASGNAGVIQVGALLEPAERSARGALLLMLATAALGALAALLGSWWLSGSALAPVTAIAAQARRIHGGGTGQQITAHADVAELQGLIAVLNDMITRLERSREWHRRIIRDLGHELRTPLAAMRAGVEVSLRGERSPEAYREALRSSLEEIARLTLISDALILLGRLESSELKLVAVRTDLVALVDEAVARADHRVGSGPRISRVSEGEVWATVDRHLVATALDHLIDNAFQHAPGATRIEVSATHADGRVRLAVEDDGTGVPDELLPHLFDLFFRADSARGREAGPGLGLTAVAEIARLHGGTATAERGARQGLRVRIDLPAD